MDRRLVLLDFDGTITRKDTLLEFIRYYRGAAHFFFGFAILSPVLVGMKLKLISNQKAKERVLRFFFGGTPAAEFNSRCIEFANSVVPELVRPAATELIKQERARQSMLSVVSASPENWVKPWCDAQGIGCLGTRLELVNDKISGNILGNNCYGEEKVRRIKEAFQVGEFQHVVAYGDSRGDMEMLELADERHYGPVTGPGLTD